MSIALAGTRSNPLQQAEQMVELGSRTGQKVGMRMSGSGEAGRGKKQPRTLTIRENRSRVISLSKS